MAETAPSIECGLAVVHPWLCDAMGHLTTRHYMAMFDDATYQLFATLGYDAAKALTEQWGWADVRHEVDYVSEVAAGTVLRIVGRIAALGRSSLTTELQLLARPDDRLCATLKGRTICFDLAARKSRPLPEFVVTASAALFGVGREPA